MGKYLSKYIYEILLNYVKSKPEIDASFVNGNHHQLNFYSHTQNPILNKR